MAYALKPEGRFVVIWGSVVTSSRRMRGLGGFRMLLALLHMAFYPRMLTRRASVKSVWYESDRGAEKHACNSLVVRALNAFMLLVIIALLPIWILVPSSLPPRQLCGRGTVRSVDPGLPHLARFLAVRLFPVPQSDPTKAVDQTS